MKYIFPRNLDNSNDILKLSNCCICNILPTILATTTFELIPPLLCCSSGMTHQPIKWSRKDEPQILELECYSKSRGVEGQSRCKAFFIHVSVTLPPIPLSHTCSHTYTHTKFHKLNVCTFYCYIPTKFRLLLRKRTTARNLPLILPIEATTSSTCTTL